MPATGITTVRDAVVELIEAAWDRDDPADEVLAEPVFEIKAEEHVGRKVYVQQLAKRDEPANRGEDANDFEFIVIVAEKFTEQGPTYTEWVDELIAFTEWLLNVLGNTATVRLLADPDDSTSGLWPQTAEIEALYDADKLRQNKLYSSAIRVTYRAEEEI